MEISLAVHIVGIVFWMGSLLYVTRLLKVVDPSVKEVSDVMVPFVRKSWFGFVLSGMVLVILTGLYQLFFRGMSYYMAQGWFHTKLTLVLVLLAVTALVGLSVRAVSEGERCSPGRMAACHGVVSGAAVIIIFLTLLGR